MGKAFVSIGRTKTTLDNYKTTEFNNLEGADIKARDDLGNVIEVSVRADGNGYRISLNGKTLASGYKYGSS